MREIMANFFGRNAELKKLRQLLKKDTASLVVIKGRRRIGKSILAIEFGNTLVFSGILPSINLTTHLERDDFARQMSRELNIPHLLHSTHRFF